MDQSSEVGLPLFLILCGILAMLLLAVAIIAFFLVYQKRLYAQEEEMRGIETAYQKDLLAYSFEAQEAERKRIASDLHDDIGSILSASRIYIHQMNPSLNSDNYEELKVETIDLIDNAINQIRGISHNLFPPNLERFGLQQAILDFCQRIQKMDGIDMHFEHPELPKLTNQQELVIYRILQELVNNTIKHAQATKIQLKFSASPNFKMIYMDNGKGFDPKDQLTAKGIGLKSIESRANSIGATAHFESEPNEGMLFELIFN